MRGGHAGHHLGVSEAVAGMFPPDNGAEPKDRKVLKRCSQATLGPALDEKPRLWMESVTEFPRERRRGPAAEEYGGRSCARSLLRRGLSLRLCPTQVARYLGLAPLPDVSTINTFWYVVSPCSLGLNVLNVLEKHLGPVCYRIVVV